MAAIGHDHAARVEMHRVDSAAVEERGDDDAGKALADRRRSRPSRAASTRPSRRGLSPTPPARSKCALDIFASTPRPADSRKCNERNSRRWIQRLLAIAAHGRVAIASSLLVVLPIADTTTTGCWSQPLAHNVRDALDRLRRFDGRPAEFHHDHRSRYPSAFISSAFSTAAPAAPRTVLWPSAMNL